MINKKSIKNSGNVLTLLSFIFIFNKMVKYKINFSSMIPPTNSISIVIIAIIIYSFVVILYSKLYQLIIKSFVNNKFSSLNVIYAYCKSNLYKYLPGNVFQYLGRNEILINESISYQIINLTTMAEIIFLLIASIIVSFVFSGQFASKWLSTSCNINPLLFLILSFIIFMTVIIIYFIRLKNSKMYLQYFNIIKQIKFSKLIKFLTAYILIFILNGLLFFIVLYTINDKVITFYAMDIIGILSFSWMIGFITPGAPAGLGIREVLISSFLNGVVDEKIIIYSVILYRTITIVGDILGFLLVYTFRIIKNK